MSSLKVAIFLVGDNLTNLNRTFSMLYSRYGVEKVNFVGVIGKSKLAFLGTELPNIPFDKLSETSFDYLIISGGGDINSSDYAAQKKFFSDKLNISRDTIIFDFEIYNELFHFPKVCLVIIFNHRFDRNLPVLRKIYGERFSNIRFLMPFYDGSDDDVIPVYESSYQFQGYLIQAYDKLKNIPCSHYLFIGDDLIINPYFDETNFIARTNMHGKKFLGRNFDPLNSPNKFRWFWAAGSSKSFYNPATNWKDSLYSYDEAMSKFKDFFGVDYKETYDEEFFGNPNAPGNTELGSWNNVQGFFNVINNFVATNNNSLRIPYPMASCCSDIFCLDKDSLFEFSRLCGIFSAMNLFVEIATPTATVLTYKRNDVTFFNSNSELLLWGNDRIIFEEKYGRNFARLYNEWDDKLCYVHPVKLSRWKSI